MTVIILAPHLQYPPRNGADIYVERLGCHLSRRRGDVYLLGARELIVYQNAQIIRQEARPNAFRAKTYAALRTIVRGSHYYIEKFLTPGFRIRAMELLAAHPGSLLICSYIASASLLENTVLSRPAIVLTHNDESAWFQNQRRFSANPLQKWVAWLSEQWVREFLRTHQQDFIYAHITAADYAGYEKIIPNQHALVVPAGVDIAPPASLPAPDGNIRLIFCGALGTKMNYDALLFFKDRFWPVFKLKFAGKVEMTIAGSQPAPAVKRLCQEQGWRLYPDVSEEALRDLFERANFSVLPFPYTTGAKLKLLTSLAAGLPVMATANMNTLPEQDFLPNLYSDDPQAWLAHLEKFSKAALQAQARLACQQFASGYAWPAIVKKMDQDMAQMGL